MKTVIWTCIERRRGMNGIKLTKWVWEFDAYRNNINNILLKKLHVWLIGNEVNTVYVFEFQEDRKNGLFPFFVSW